MTYHSINTPRFFRSVRKPNQQFHTKDITALTILTLQSFITGLSSLKSLMFPFYNSYYSFCFSP